MNVASLENCKELYELSRWDAAYSATSDISLPKWGVSKVPQYDLGYLMRKFPREIDNYWLELSRGTDWFCGYRSFDHNSILKGHFEFAADTPEDAACKLAIELFKSGVLHSGNV